MPRSALAAAHEHAKKKLGGKKANWNRAADPAAALWLTLERVGWQWPSATTFVDDSGDQWCTCSDPPVAIVAAMSRTVRRRRFEQVASLHQGIISTRPDVGAGLQGKRDFIVEFANVLAPLASCKEDTLVSAPEFARKRSSALLSAAAGG